MEVMRSGGRKRALALVARAGQRRPVVSPTEPLNVDSLFIPTFPYQKRLQPTRLNIAGNRRTCSDSPWGGCSDSSFPPSNGSKSRFES